MLKNQIKVKRIETGTKTIFTIKNNMVYTATGRNHVYCSCTGNTVETATPMEYNDKEGVFCPNCHVKKVEIIQTYDEWKAEEDEKARKMNEEKLANLHIVEAGSDWECGFKYYCLSANIEYDDWLKVKKHFTYYRKGWSRGKELEWEYGEPTGWLTQNPKEVEEILVDNGLIKSENTMEEIAKRNEIEKQLKEAKLKENVQKRKALKVKINAVEKQVLNEFEDVKVLSDAEAREHFFNSDYGKNTIITYRITCSEIIKCQHMGDFIYGVSVPFSEKLKSLIAELYSLHDELAKY